MIVGVINVQFIILILTLSLHIAAMNQSLTMECLSKRLLPTLLPPSVPTQIIVSFLSVEVAEVLELRLLLCRKSQVFS